MPTATTHLSAKHSTRLKPELAVAMPNSRAFGGANGAAGIQSVDQLTQTAVTAAIEMEDQAVQVSQLRLVTLFRQSRAEDEVALTENIAELLVELCGHRLRGRPLRQPQDELLLHVPHAVIHAKEIQDLVDRRVQSSVRQ